MNTKYSSWECLWEVGHQHPAQTLSLSLRLDPMNHLFLIFPLWRPGKVRRGLTWHSERGAEIQPRSWSHRPSPSPAPQPRWRGFRSASWMPTHMAAQGSGRGGTGLTETRQGSADAGPVTGKRSHLPGDTDVLSCQEVWGRAAARFLTLLAQPCRPG